MKNQKENERAEQQRIKNLVLNYDLQESNTDQDGTDNNLYSIYFSQPNPNLPKHYFNPATTVTHDHMSQGLGSGEKHGGASHHQHNASLHQSSPAHGNARPVGSGTHRGQRARKLQLSDVDW